MLQVWYWNTSSKRRLSPLADQSSGSMGDPFPSDSTTRAFGLHAQNTSELFPLLLYYNKKKDLPSIFSFLQSQWERRILKSLNSMCSELGLCLAKPRCKDEQNEYAGKWNELSTLDIDLSLFRPVYAPKDFLEILTQVLCLHVSDICRGLENQVSELFGWK